MSRRNSVVDNYTRASLFACNWKMTYGAQRRMNGAPTSSSVDGASKYPSSKCDVIVKFRLRHLEHNRSPSVTTWSVCSHRETLTNRKSTTEPKVKSFSTLVQYLMCLWSEPTARVAKFALIHRFCETTAVAEGQESPSILPLSTSTGDKLRFRVHNVPNWVRLSSKTCLTCITERSPYLLIAVFLSPFAAGN
jgi:hypothetical protein